MKDWRKPAGVFAVVAAAVVLIDHAAKLAASMLLPEASRISYLGGFLHLEPLYNTGAILGLGSQLPEAIRSWTLPVVTGAVLVWVSILLIREPDTGPAFVGLSMVWAGGFSNLVDRLAYGKVFDFFNIGFGTVRTGTSNLADVAILAGIPLILIGWLRARQQEEEPGT